MHSRNFWFGLVASVVTVALAIGVLLLSRSVAGDEVELPDGIGDLVAVDTPAAFPGRDVPAKAVDSQRMANQVNADGYSEVFDDADADARVYVDPTTDQQDYVSVVAIAADMGPLLPQEGFVDPEQRGFALPELERITDGDVECLLLRNLPPRAGTDYRPDEAAPDAIYCQRRSGTLTVRTRAATGNLDAMVDLVDDLWDELD